MASEELRGLLAVSGPIDVTGLDSRSTPGFEGDKDDAERAIAVLADELADEQERLYAGGRAGTTERSVLLVLQGMDTSGKGGTIRAVVGLVDPQGVQITSFGAPTSAELEHDFLWRVAHRLPKAGRIGVFDRSHYEDVLIGRVRELAPTDEIERRYDAINDFERAYVEAGGVLVKCYLHIDLDDQADRLRDRLENPDKHWKYDPRDLDERELWADYQRAYEIALERCSPVHAPWYVVPAGRKWYRNWAVATLVLETLRSLGLEWPAADFDPAAELARLDADQATSANSPSSGTRSTAPTA